MRTFEAQGYPLRMLASQFSQRSEEIRVMGNQFVSQVTILSSGGDRWTGQGAQAFVAQAEVLINRVEKTVHAFQLTSNTLYQLADRADVIHALKQKKARLQEELTALQHRQFAFHTPEASSTDDARIHQLQSEISQLEWEIEQYADLYDRDAQKQFNDIAYMAPTAKSLLQDMEAATMIYGPSLDPGMIPVLVKPDPKARKGQERTEYLNDLIMMNKVVYEYYETHPNAKGPNGESAAEMRGLALEMQNEARREGGTIGVPIVFMHGLEGDETTFEKMVDAYGGPSKIYKYNKDGTVEEIDGPNADADQPIIQYVFEDGAMHFQDQVDAFTKMTDQLKRDTQTSYFMVAAHSMGGVITTKYIEDTGGHDILRFATLGSPILGSDVDKEGNEFVAIHKALTLLSPIQQIINNKIRSMESEYPAVYDLEKDSVANQEIYENRGKFNQNIDVFSGAGDAFGKRGDGVVLPDSAFGLKDFADPSRFHTKMYPNDNHTQLHDDSEEINDVKNFLRYGVYPDENK